MICSNIVDVLGLAAATAAEVVMVDGRVGDIFPPGGGSLVMMRQKVWF